uniref:hypothetical protein n=1 Tax=Alistipes putredinis TaxID=28117 RepID=UPI003FD8B8CD
RKKYPKNKLLLSEIKLNNYSGKDKFCSRFEITITTKRTKNYPIQSIFSPRQAETGHSPIRYGCNLVPLFTKIRINIL